MKKNIPYLEEWLELANSGNFNKAQELYYENLFNAVIDNFKNNYKNKIDSGGVLFSILGFSPEPIILTAKAVEPEKHIIFTTNNKSDGNDYLEKFLDSNYEMIYIEDEDFNTLYKALKESLILNPNSNMNPTDNTKFPTRWQYPQNEINYNTDNLNEAVQRQYNGSDDFNGIMWILKE